MIKIVSLVKTYGQDLEKITALNGVSLEIKDNCMFAIIGDSGSGKSTLLNIIGGLDRANSGSVFVDDVEVTKLEEKELRHYRNKTIGFIFQSFFLEPKLTVLDNVTMPSIIAGVAKKEREEKAKLILEKLNIDKYMNKKSSDLSGGEKQRVAIARALINDPKIIIADEPTGNLDSKNSENVMEILKEISKEKTVIVVTHNKDYAKNYADSIIELVDGKIKEESLQ